MLPFMEALSKFVQRVGPYVVMAIVLPGGTFVALGLYLYRRQRVEVPTKGDRI